MRHESQANKSCQPTPVEHVVREVDRGAGRGCILRSACGSFVWPSHRFPPSVYGSSRLGLGREESNGGGWATARPRSSIDVVGGWEFRTGMVTPNQAVEATSTQRTVSRLRSGGCRLAVGGRASPHR